MKSTALAFLVVLAVGSVLAQQAYFQSANQAESELAPVQATGDNLIAIDILLEPNQTMVDKANAVNAVLRENIPTGYSLDATHAPHVTLLQRFIRARDLPAVTAALTKVFVADPPTALQLKAQGIDYVMWAGFALNVFVVERSPELMRLEEEVNNTVEPFSVSGGTGAAFVGTDINAETIGWVEDFIPKSSGANYIPHVTLGISKQDFANHLKAAPFTSFTFSPVGVAVFHLGNFGTANTKLWSYHPASLASWNDGPAKQSVLSFVRRVTTEGGPDYVPVSDRIATFDNDGTLWCEQPLYFQGMFVLDRVRDMAPQCRTKPRSRAT